MEVRHCVELHMNVLTTKVRQKKQASCVIRQGFVCICGRQVTSLAVVIQSKHMYVDWSNDPIKMV